MGDSVPDAPASPSSQQPNLPMLYYGLIVVVASVTLLAIYNLIVAKWCARRRQELRPSPGPLFGPRSLESVSLMKKQLALSSFKYGKEAAAAAAAAAAASSSPRSNSSGDCVVCLSEFEEGEDVLRLPRCGHCFHERCIDMWLYSHSDCPLCRAPVLESQQQPPPPPMPLLRREEAYREGLLGSGSLV